MTENNTNRWEDKKAYRSEMREFRGTGSGRVWTGLILILIGAIAFLRVSGFPIPRWLFTWQMLLIVIGLVAGLRNQFRGGFWIVLIFIGLFFQFRDFFPEYALGRYIWPIGLIGLGLIFLLRPRRSHPWGGPGDHIVGGSVESEHVDDVIDSTSIFGGTKKNIVSKDFKGGEVVNIFGGSEIDLTQAEIHGTVKLECTQIFGGTKLIVPPHWQIKPEVVAIFGGVEDKRRMTNIVSDPNKILVLHGTSIFAGIEIKSY